MDQQIRIRPATPDDAPAIAYVHVEVWRTTYRGLLPDDVLAQLSVERRSEGWRQAAAQSGQAGRALFVAHEDGRIVGFAGCGPERTGDPRYTGELYAVYVLESHQRQGIGRSLVRYVVEALVSGAHRAMLLWVLTANVGARRFYESLGGHMVREQLIEIGGAHYSETAYGWDDLPGLLQRLSAVAGSRPG